jgi:hypothetical protein
VCLLWWEADKKKADIIGTRRGIIIKRFHQKEFGFYSRDLNFILVKVL